MMLQDSKNEIEYNSHLMLNILIFILKSISYLKLSAFSDFR